MKNNVYRNAVDRLQFSGDLEQAVRSKSAPRRAKFRFTQLVALTAILCLLFGTTVFAAEQIRERTLRVRETGRIRKQFGNVKIMEFTCSDGKDGVDIHQMELKPKGDYHFGEGLIYHPPEGFLKVSEEYELEVMENRSLNIVFEKNGRTYRLHMEYVEAEGGIYSNLLNYYPVTDDEIIVNMTAEGSHCWPVYVNIKTGVCRDALPGFDEDDFLPEMLESGYKARVCFSQPFKDGILISALVSGIRNGNTDSRSLYYWIRAGSEEVIKLNLPQNSIDYIMNNTLYYQDSAGNCYVMDETFQFRKIDGVRETTDNVNCGLLTMCSKDGALEILDILNPAVYYVPGIAVKENSLWDTTGYNATRHSQDGKIVVTHSYNDYEAGNRPVNSIAYLDLAAGELRQLYIDADCHVQTHGWLDDDRYCIIYEEGLKRFLSVYEFE